MSSWRRDHPTPGWKGRRAETGTALVNPRPPAVPATLNLTLEEYYAAAALMGLLPAQTEQPERDWLTDEALAIGETMAAKAKARRAARTSKP